MVVNTPAVAPPPPTEPQVNYEATTLHTITITIQPASDTNGKVIFHQVIVEIPGKVTKRQIFTLPDNFTNYREARRKGEKFYMAASLSRDALSTSKVFVLGDGKTYGGYKNVQLEPGTRYRAYIRGVIQDNGRFLYGVPTEISLPPTLGSASLPPKPCLKLDNSSKGPSLVWMMAAIIEEFFLLILTVVMGFGYIRIRRKSQGLETFFYTLLHLNEDRPRAAQTRRVKNCKDLYENLDNKLKKIFTRKSS
ncbi:receptor-type tyrosine-protein phosphatase mu-like [Montipora foliosa]|uniref:receptor-type tyrosine-protein phosphatase mu-like n=1 Tax=Montipora foliosa TaxID=591990 RepID=UPI0035F174AC